MSVYYNENDPKAAAWLRMLIQERVIPAGVVDERSITEVRPTDLTGFTQCHFFAGIGGWAEALRLAGWGERPVWTGSCPCQPFSAAGKGLGQDDPRHLWPVWFELIRQCRPLVIFGEQVASRAALSWLDTVQDDLESEIYTLGAVDLCVAGVGAPHIRQRLYWVAECAIPGRIQAAAGPNQAWRSDAMGDQRRVLESATTAGRMADPEPQHDRSRIPRQGRGIELANSGAVCAMAHANQRGQQAGIGPETYGRAPLESEREGEPRKLAHANADRCAETSGRELRYAEHNLESCGIMGNADQPRPQGRGVSKTDSSGDGSDQWLARPSGPDGRYWADCEWLQCTDGKARPVEPGSFPLAHGIPGRVGLLRGYGNAIIPEAAAEFITAYMQIR